MAWGSLVEELALNVPQAGEVITTNTPTLEPAESIHYTVEITAGGGTDDLVIEVQSTVNGTDYDTVPVLPVSLASGQRALTLSGLYQVRVRLSPSGVTDSFTVNVRYRIGTP